MSLSFFWVVSFEMFQYFTNFQTMIQNCWITPNRWTTFSCISYQCPKTSLVLQISALSDHVPPPAPSCLYFTYLIKSSLLLCRSSHAFWISCSFRSTSVPIVRWSFAGFWNRLLLTPWSYWKGNKKDLVGNYMTQIILELFLLGSQFLAPKVKKPIRQPQESTK